MNADQERRVKFEAETNYNKRFRLTRRKRIGERCPNTYHGDTEARRRAINQKKAHRGDAESGEEQGRIFLVCDL
jgi:hypothetical protein